jgi:outer membrane protein assembly factor BamB
MIRSRQLQAALLAVFAASFLAACGGGDKKVVKEPAELQPIEVERLEIDRVWKTDTGDGAGDYESGYRLGYDGRHLYTANRDGRVVALDRETGKRVWRVDTETRVISGPAIGQDRLVLGTRDGEILALSLEDGSELWRADVSGEVLAPPAIGENRVVAYSQDGRLGGFELQTGDRRWTIQRSVPPLTLRGNASPIVDGDLAIALCLTLKAVDGPSYRATQGFFDASLFSRKNLSLNLPH